MKINKTILNEQKKKVKKAGVNPTHLIIPEELKQRVVKLKGFITPSKIKPTPIEYVGDILGMEVWVEPLLDNNVMYMLDKDYFKYKKGE